MTVLVTCICLFVGGGAFAFVAGCHDIDLSIRRTGFWVMLSLWFFGGALAGSVVWRAVQ
jgi:hypothetical protein